MTIDQGFVTILIVTYNSIRYIDDVVSSIQRHCPDSEVVVVDNFSSDGTAEYVERQYPFIHLIKSLTNLGFAKGNNLAASFATKPYLLLLNPDAFLLSSIEPAIELLNLQNDIGIVGARMLGNDMEYRHSAGFFPYYSKIFIIAQLYKRDGAFAKGNFMEDGDAMQVDWVEGSFLLTRRDLWDKFGGMDESYFMYLEEVDFSKRVLDEGFKTIYLPCVSYQHIGGYNESRLDYLIKGFRLFNRKHANIFKRIAANIVLDVGLLCRIVRSSILALIGVQGQKNRAIKCISALINR